MGIIVQWIESWLAMTSAHVQCQFKSLPVQFQLPTDALGNVADGDLSV